MKAFGSSVSSSAKASARASTGRERALPAQVRAKLTSASESASAGSEPGTRAAQRREPAAAIRSLRRWTSSVPAGATIATHSRPSRQVAVHFTWPSSCATTLRTWSGGKSSIRLS